MAGKTPTQRGISVLLARTFQKSRSTPSRIRGLRNHSDGYVVASGYEGVVWVHHEVVSMRPLPEDRKRIADMLEKYTAVIEAAGFAVERTSDRLIVKAKED